MKVHFHKDAGMPDSIAELHREVIPDLAKLLFDTTLNRLQIKEAIDSHELLMLALNCYSQCFMSLIRPRPAREPRFRSGDVDITGFHFGGNLRDHSPRPKVMPEIFGFIFESEFNDTWWVSSNEEFRSNADDPRTSNIGTQAKFELYFGIATLESRPIRRRRRPVR